MWLVPRSTRTHRPTGNSSRSRPSIRRTIARSDPSGASRLRARVRGSARAAAEHWRTGCVPSPSDPGILRKRYRDLAARRDALQFGRRQRGAAWNPGSRSSPGTPRRGVAPRGALHHGLAVRCEPRVANRPAPECQTAELGFEMRVPIPLVRRRSQRRTGDEHPSRRATGATRNRWVGLSAGRPWRDPELEAATCSSATRDRGPTGTARRAPSRGSAHHPAKRRRHVADTLRAPPDPLEDRRHGLGRRIARECATAGQHLYNTEPSAKTSDRKLTGSPRPARVTCIRACPTRYRRRSAPASHRPGATPPRPAAPVRNPGPNPGPCRPVGRHDDVSGLSSRWTMPRSCAAARPRAICAVYSDALRGGSGPLAIRSRRVGRPAAPWPRMWCRRSRRNHGWRVCRDG